KVNSQQKFRDLLYAAGEAGDYNVNGKTVHVDIDNLGATTEASVNAVDYFGRDGKNNHATYGNLHNDGHIHFMLYDNTTPYGVMGDTSTAIRDPIFFRWHKQIDDIFYKWQERQPPNGFDNGPNVKIHDIILVLADGLPASIDGQKFGTKAYSDK